MSNAKRDENRTTVGLALDATDGVTLLPLVVDSITNRLFAVATSDTITATSATDVKRDENHKPTYYGVSFADGVTPIPIRTDENGLLLAAF